MQIATQTDGEAGRVSASTRSLSLVQAAAEAAVSSPHYFTDMDFRRTHRKGGAVLRHANTRLGKNRVAVTYSVGARGLEVYRVYNLTHGSPIGLTRPMVEAFTAHLAQRAKALRRAA